MVKKLLLFWCFSTFLSAFFPAYGSNVTALPGSLKEGPFYCDAPAPEDFKVTTNTSEFVSVSWKPVWPGALQTLELSIEDNGEWIPLWTKPDVPGDSFTFENLEPGSYSAKIATNCSSGETSFKTAEVLFGFKIIDLTTAGRMPKDPKPVEDCEHINFLENEWVGFRVKKLDSGVYNFFEFKYVEQSRSIIKRVFTNNQIVAVNSDWNFPILPTDSIKTINPVGINDTGNGGSGDVVQIGFINCFFVEAGIIKLCIAVNNAPLPWKPEYEFTAMVAKEVLTNYPNDPGISGNKSNETMDFFEKYKAQSPFGSTITVSCPENILESESTWFRLFDLEGKKMMEYRVESKVAQVTFPVEKILPGIYLLQIGNSRGTEVKKVIKSERF